MILSTHFVAGAAVASYTDSPILLAVLPLFLHFLLDMFPHWEYLDEFSELKQRITQTKLALDIAAGPLFVLFAVFFSYGTDLKKLFWFFFAGAVGVFPDALSFFHFLFPRNKILKKIFNFHQFIHSRKELDWKVGTFIQLLIDALAIFLIMTRLG